MAGPADLAGVRERPGPAEGDGDIAEIEVGATITGTVARIENYGAFLQLDRLHLRAVEAAIPLALDTAQTPSSEVESIPTASHAEPPPQPRLALQPPVAANARPSLTPLSPSRYKLQLTAGQQLHDKLQQARDLMRHELPDGDLALVVERALDLLIAERMKRRFGIGRRPRAAAQKLPKDGSRHIPHAVQRTVVARDQLQCTFVSSEGKRCSERGWLQLHHDKPFGRGGPATDDNIRVLCGAHNRLLAERDYGRDYVRRRIEHARRIGKPPGLVLGILGPGAGRS